MKWEDVCLGVHFTCMTRVAALTRASQIALGPMPVVGASVREFAVSADSLRGHLRRCLPLRLLSLVDGCGGVHLGMLPLRTFQMAHKCVWQPPAPPLPPFSAACRVSRDA